MHICYMEKEFDVSPTDVLVKVLDDHGIHEGNFVVSSTCGRGREEIGHGWEAREFVCDSTDEDGIPMMLNRWYAPVEMWREMKDHTIGEIVCGHRSVDGEITLTHFDDEFVLPHKQRLINFKRKDGAK